MIFSALSLHPSLQKALDSCGYKQMTRIQEQAIIPARRGKDLLASAQTGTGKTAAFSIPILQQISDKPKATIPCNTRALILTPTRELTEQVANAVKRYAQFLPIRITALYGGTKTSAQEKKLKAGNDIIVATPRRLREHLEQGNIKLSNVEFVVLDEADRMLDMGFISDVYSLLQKTQKKRQTLLFSATLSQAVKELANKLLVNHQTIGEAKQNAIADTIEHVVYAVEEQRKTDLFMDLFGEHNWFKVLVFTSTKAQADNLMKRLKPAGIRIAICHGDKTQGARRRAIADFKSDKVQILIATEVAARGLDIQGLDYVINYNLPYLAEDYVHRIGRCGRAGQPGQAISFVSREEERALHNIEHIIGDNIKRIEIPTYTVADRKGIFKKLEQRRKPPRQHKDSRTKIARGEKNSLAKTKNKTGNNNTKRKRKK